jgi:hypothetical protein
MQHGGHLRNLPTRAQNIGIRVIYHFTHRAVGHMGRSLPILKFAGG